MNFTSHVSYHCKKASKKLNVFPRIAFSLKLEQKKLCLWFCQASVLLQCNCLDNSQPKIE